MSRILLDIFNFVNRSKTLKEKMHSPETWLYGNCLDPSCLPEYTSTRSFVKITAWLTIVEKVEMPALSLSTLSGEMGVCKWILERAPDSLHSTDRCSNGFFCNYSL